MPDRYLIRLPWPPRKSSPNGSQGDKFGKARAGKAYKAQCTLECKAHGLRPMGIDEAQVTVTFCPPDNRRRDLDNALASAKRGLDAVSDAIGVDDSKWRRMILERGPAVDGGCILVDVRAYVAEPEFQLLPIVGQIS